MSDGERAAALHTLGMGAPSDVPPKYLQRRAADAERRAQVDREATVRATAREVAVRARVAWAVAVVTVMIYVIHCIMRNNEAPSNV